MEHVVGAFGVRARVRVRPARRCLERVKRRCCPHPWRCSVPRKAGHTLGTQVANKKTDDRQPFRPDAVLVKAPQSRVCVGTETYGICLRFVEKERTRPVSSLLTAAGAAGFVGRSIDRGSGNIHNRESVACSCCLAGLAGRANDPLVGERSPLVSVFCALLCCRCCSTCLKG